MKNKFRIEHSYKGDKLIEKLILYGRDITIGDIIYVPYYSKYFKIIYIDFKNTEIHTKNNNNLVKLRFDLCIPIKSLYFKQIQNDLFLNKNN